MLSGRRTVEPANLRITYSNTAMKGKVKCLRVILNNKPYSRNIMYIARKTDYQTTTLTMLMPNVGRPHTESRKIFAFVKHSFVLYAGPA